MAVFSLWQRIKNMNLMLWALVLGTIAGILFGERLEWLAPVGRVFIQLMQVTIFPYIVVSLMLGLGKFDPSEVRSIILKAAMVMVSLWLVGLVAIFAFAFSLPELQAGTFFSPLLVNPLEDVDFAERFIPVNPFASLAEGNVPAVVIFFIALGMALMGNKNKDNLLSVLSVISEALATISKNTVKIFPIGIFAITASVAGTLSVEELQNLKVYLLLSSLLAIFLIFVCLPLIVSAFTPVPYRGVIRIGRDALITAFSTGNVFITLPVIVEGIKEYLHEHKLGDKQSDYIAEVLVPIAFTFPSLGKLTTLIFVIFAAWLTGNEISWQDFPELSVTALLSYFANVHIAIPYLLESQRVPTDAYQLYLALSVVTAKFVSPTTVVYIVGLTLMSIFVIRKDWQVKRAKTMFMSGVVLAVLPAFVILANVLSHSFMEEDKAADEIIANMTVAEKVPAHVLNHVPQAYAQGQLSLTNIGVIKERNLLRVGYVPENVPFSYFNRNQELVGFDISLAHELANDLNVDVEFIPFQKSQLVDYLNRGYFDIAMSGLDINFQDMEKVMFTNPVLDLQLALVTKDHRLRYFKNLPDILAHENLTVVSADYAPLLRKLAKRHPNYQFERIESYRDFFEQENDQYDLLLISAEAGFSWTMFYPEYGVVVPTDVSSHYPTGFAVAKRHGDLLNYLNSWLAVVRLNGRIDEHYDYWILGKGTTQKVKRWSVIDEYIEE